MITNERQQRITQREAKRFEAAIAQAQQEGPSNDIHPRLHQALIDGLRSQLKDLRAELREYEALRAGEVKRRVFASLLDLPTALIEARIVRHLTHKELGKRLGVAEQQVQRYEKTRYAGVSLERLQEVVDALEINLRKTIDYGVPREKESAHVGAVAAGSTARSRVSSGRSPGRSSRHTKGGERVASRKTGKTASSAAGKTLASKSASKAAKRAAASDLAQVRNQKATSRKAASAAAGKTLASKSASKTAKKAAASDLSQRARKKR
jgi:DNA-binding Xre family transcriptional regulator